MSAKIFLIVHKKSANEEVVKAAVKTVQKEGIDLRVLVPWDQKENLRIIRNALGKGVERIIAGGGDGTINAIVNSLVGEAACGLRRRSVFCRSAQRMILRAAAVCRRMI